MKWKKYYILLILILLSNLLFFRVHSETEEELRNRIEDRNSQIKLIEEEIRQYNIEVLNAGSQAKTLQNTIKTLDLTNSKLSKDINLTESKISKTNLTIEQIGNEIITTEENIDVNKKAVINAIRNINFIDDIHIVNLLLSNKNISQIWNDIDNINQIRESIIDKSKSLVDLKLKMEQKQNSLSSEKKNLIGYKQDLSGKKQAVEYTVAEKAQVLKQTKSKELAFKELVKTKEELKAQYERDVYDFESKLNILIDKGSYPAPKNGIISWPLDDVYVTQKFGKTVGAEKLYASGTHNGVDFRAPIGTRVKNVLTGTVIGTGNTDVFKGCYSFGKWVMVRHENGLSTIYSHLSVISVNRNQILETGDLIGYSGNTGYSTGPHLHIGLYATQGVRIEQFVSSRGCKLATIPLADIKAYLDPLAYFPEM